MSVQLTLHGYTVADQQHTMPKLFGCVNCSFDFGYRSLIAPHRIYGNGYHSLRLTRSRRGLFRRGFDDFATLVLSALRADAVGLFRFVAVRALGARGLGQCVVGAASLRALVGMSAFRIRHGVSLSLLTFLNLKFLLNF